MKDLIKLMDPKYIEVTGILDSSWRHQHLALCQLWQARKINTRSSQDIDSLLTNKNKKPRQISENVSSEVSAKPYIKNLLELRIILGARPCAFPGMPCRLPAPHPWYNKAWWHRQPTPGNTSLTIQLGIQASLNHAESQWGTLHQDFSLLHAGTLQLVERNHLVNHSHLFCLLCRILLAEEPDFRVPSSDLPFVPDKKNRNRHQSFLP